MAVDCHVFLLFLHILTTWPGRDTGFNNVDDLEVRNVLAGKFVRCCFVEYHYNHYPRRFYDISCYLGSPNPLLIRLSLPLPLPSLGIFRYLL